MVAINTSRWPDMTADPGRNDERPTTTTPRAKSRWYAYAAYGATTVFAPDGTTVRATSSVGNPYMYTGRRLDPEFASTSADTIYYYRARYYDPNQGRFIERDPLEYVDGMSMFMYVSGRPLKSTDPAGLSKIGEILYGDGYVFIDKSCLGASIATMHAKTSVWNMGPPSDTWIYPVDVVSIDTVHGPKYLKITDNVRLQIHCTQDCDGYRVIHVGGYKRGIFGGVTDVTTDAIDPTKWPPAVTGPFTGVI